MALHGLFSARAFPLARKLRYPATPPGGPFPAAAPQNGLQGTLPALDHQIINLPAHHIYLKLRMDRMTSRPFSGVALGPPGRDGSQCG